jgi:ABC-type Fe3+/spermidine/putrescine transport system ATPase subunit
MTARTAVPVRVERIRKSYGALVALDDVTLDFPAGGFSTLLGPSGCGKTTLLRSIAGFETPEAGGIFVGGRDVAAEPPWRRRIGFVFQSYALWPHMTVGQNVAYGLKLRSLPGFEIDGRVAGVLERVGMAGLGHRHPGQLSGGQQQRVALARALVLEPDVLLLDEPLSNLDARLRVEMRREIRRLQREVGITTIYVTHDQEEALELSDVVAVMSQGRVEQVGSAEEVYRRPRSPFVAAFLGATALLAGEVQADGALVVSGHRLALGLPSTLAGRQVSVALHPEDVVLEMDGATTGLSATVVESAYLGHAWRVVARLGDGTELAAFSARPATPGQTVRVTPRHATVVDGGV